MLPGPATESPARGRGFRFPVSDFSGQAAACSPLRGIVEFVPVGAPIIKTSRSPGGRAASPAYRAPGAREFLATIEMMGASQSMPGDEKVGFYLRHWQDIEEWAALRTQSLGQFEDSFVRAAEVKRGVHDGPNVEESDSAQWRWYGFELALPAIAPARAFVAFGWTHGQLFGSAGETLPYVGIKLDGASQQVFATAKELLRDAAQACHWPKSGGNWVWYGYLPFGASDTDLDAYAEKQMDGPVAAYALVQSTLHLT
jgi:hypothetical protein